MATSGLYGNSSESIGLYGNTNVFGGTYFQWFIFIQSTGSPATPTGGSWDFDTNIGTPPTGWSVVAPQIPNAILWFSVAFVDSRNPTLITWSAPSLLSTATSIYSTMYADVFTGNGTQTNWTLTASPVSINNINVSINGVVQVPNVDYTFSGTILITTSAVLLNAVMLVKYGQSTATPNFADNAFSIYDSVDITKIATFEVAGLTTATTRTYTLPNSNGTVALLSSTQTFSGDTTFTGVLKVANPIGTNAAASTIASGTIITPSKAITFVSGTTPVNTIVPTFFSGVGGSIVLIPTGVFTWTAAGNIALAGTAVVNKALTMTYDSGTGKWYPSYIA